MKRTALSLMLAASFAAAQEDPWKDQEARTKSAISAAEAAVEGGSMSSSDYGSSSRGDKLGVEHAKAALKKQKQRLSAIEKGRKLEVPPDRKDRGQYPTEIIGTAAILLGGSWKPLQEGFPLVVGDQVGTGPGSRLTLWLSGGFLTLGDETKASIAEEKVVLLSSGLMHWENLAVGGKEWQCRTPAVDAAVKGTEFDMAHSGSTSLFRPVSGVVELRSKGKPKARPAPKTPLPKDWVGRADSVEGAMIQKGEKGEWRPLAFGDRLEYGDRIKTAIYDEAVLTLEGELRAKVLPNTVFELRKKTYSLIEGAIRVWTWLDKGAGERDIRFKTPQSVAAVRGTAFTLRFDPNHRRDEIEPDGGVLAVTTQRPSGFEDARQWWNSERRILR